MPIFYHIRCISVVPLLFIYFIKDAKKKLERVSSSLSDCEEKLAVCIQVGRIQRACLSWHCC